MELGMQLYLHIILQVQGKTSQVPKSAQFFCMPGFSFRLSPRLTLASIALKFGNYIPYVIISTVFFKLLEQFIFDELLTLFHFYLRFTYEIENSFWKNKIR